MSAALESWDVVYSLAEEQDFQQVSNIYFLLWSHYTVKQIQSYFSFPALKDNSS